MRSRSKVKLLRLRPMRLYDAGWYIFDWTKKRYVPRESFRHNLTGLAKSEKTLENLLYAQARGQLSLPTRLYGSIRLSDPAVAS